MPLEIKQKKKINVEGKKLGEGYPCFIVAEAGINHNGSLELAKRLIDVAKEAGADAVKFQIFIPEEIATLDAVKGNYQKETGAEEESQYRMLKKLALTEEEFALLKDYAQQREIIFYATPHDLISVDILESLDLPIIKIASPDLDNGLMLYKISKNPKLRTKPLFMSTGGSTLFEVKKSLQFLRSHGFKGQILVYQCTSSYPTPTAEQDLAVIKTFKKELGREFDALVGFSDNGDKIEVPIDAVTLGAVSVEKHLTLDKNMKGPDHQASLNPSDFGQMVAMIRDVEMTKSKKIKHPHALGNGVKKIKPSEISNIEVFRKAVRAKRDLLRGSKITIEALTAKRTKGTFSPLDFEKLLGKKLRTAVKKDQEITPEMIS